MVIDLIWGRKHPVAEPPSLVAAEMAKKLEARTYKTHKARLVTYQRLRFRGVAWNAFLISSATATTIASVGMLSNPALYGAHGDALLAMLAIVSLVASLVVANMNYGGRSQSVEANYKRIQQISLAAGSLVTRGCSLVEVRNLEREYEIALESSENHSGADYQRSLENAADKWGVWRDEFVSVVPFLMLLAPVVVAIPVAMWLAGV